MRKVSAICVYDGMTNQIYNVTVNVRGDNVTLLHYAKSDFLPQPYKYNKFWDLYEDVLNIIKNNGYYVHTWNMFDTVFYDISFIDMNHPTAIDRFPHGRKEK